MQSSTRKTYNHHWAVFQNFINNIPDAEALPASVEHVGLFVAYLHEANYQPTTVRNYLSAISFIHKLHNLCDPTNNFMINKAVQGSGNLHKSSKKQALLPITETILKDIVKAVPHCVQGPYNVSLYKALFLLSFYACLRAGEAVHSTTSAHTLQFEQVQEIETPKGIGFKIQFLSYKHSGHTQQSLVIEPLSQKYCPVRALQNFITIRGSKKGPLFTHMSGHPLSRHDFSATLKSCLEFKGYCSKSYNTHSFRIGRATDLAAKQTPHTIIKSTGRWKSSAYQKYIRPTSFTLPS